MKKYFLFLIVFFSISCTASFNNSDTLMVKGFYSQTDSSAIFTDCQTNTSYPIAFEEDYKSLKKAYTDVADNTGDSIVVTFDARMEVRKSIDGIEKKFIIIERFKNIWPKINCYGNLGTANLKNSFWVLRKINNPSIHELNSMKHVSMIINADNSLKGYGGCNNFDGSVSINDEKISFININFKSMECKNTSLENEFFEALRITDTYKIYGEYLYLFSTNKKLAIFESIYIN